MRNLLIILSGIPGRWWLISLSLLLRFCFWFWTLWLYWISVVSLWVHSSSYLEFIKFLECLYSDTSSNLRCLWPLFLLIFSPLFLSPFFLLSSRSAYVGWLNGVSQVGSVHFFFHFFFLLILILDHLHCPIFNFTDSFLCLLKYVFVFLE